MSMYPIASQTVGAGGANSITFSSIPQTFTHLQLRTFQRNTNSGSNEAFSVVTFNGDTGQNYSSISFFGNGSSTTSFSQNQITNGSYGTSTYGPEAPNDGTTANVYASGIVDIFDYTNTNKYKTLKTLTGFDSNGFGFVFIHSGLWMNTNAITSITVLSSGTSFKANSTYQLYGMLTSNVGTF